MENIDKFLLRINTTRLKNNKDKNKRKETKNCRPGKLSGV